MKRKYKLIIFWIISTCVCAAIAIGILHLENKIGTLELCHYLIYIFVGLLWSNFSLRLEKFIGHSLKEKEESLNV